MAKIKPPDDMSPLAVQSNVPAPDSGLKRQSYNAQAPFTTYGSQLIVGSRISTCAADHGDLIADAESVTAVSGRVNTISAESGFASFEQIDDLERRHRGAGGDASTR